ncbi:MAG: 4Fe-4S binding protein, partial [Acidobacteriia bacterium]|nr:4Fe-4S binding protein [Terriglobia bacterium]
HRLIAVAQIAAAERRVHHFHRRQVAALRRAFGSRQRQRVLNIRHVLLVQRQARALLLIADQHGSAIRSLDTRQIIQVGLIRTTSSKGTKTFCLVGAVKNTAMIEVPLGITLRKVVEEIGGGVPEGRHFKAIQTGGPSGGCVPEALLDTQVDYEGLTGAGTIMGSGGMIVMDDSTCMVDIAKYFLAFLADESCGKCFSCREGLQRMQEIVTHISQGHGTEDDLTLLEDLGWLVRETSLCGLGQTAPNPVLSTLRYFRDEYLAHVRDKRCPAKVCRQLIAYRIEPTLCDGCGACVRVCTSEAILGEKKKAHVIDNGKCIKCGACLEVCQPKAIFVE